MPQPTHSPFRAVIRGIAFLIWSFTLATSHVIVRWIRPDKKLWLPMLWHRGCCWIFGIRVIVYGEISQQHPLLFVSNHVSYLDINILGSVLPTSFISKADVKHWPIIGWLAGLRDTLFIERVGSQVKTQLSQIQNRLNYGDNLVLFAEGTSTDGSSVLPFKSALFRSVEQGEAWIQPVSLSYRLYDDQPMTQTLRDYYAWYTEISAPAHMWKMQVCKAQQSSYAYMTRSIPKILLIANKLQRLVGNLLQWV